MRKLAFLLIVLNLATINLFSQKSLLQSGPMLGYSEMRECIIWIQTKSECEVKIQYYDLNNPSKKFWTNSIKTKKHAAFTAKLIADQVEPGKTYQYDVYLNNYKLKFDYPTKFKSQAIWKWRADPPEFTLLTGS